MTDTPKPSARAQTMLQRGQEAANREVRRHLDAGRSVYGRRNGEPVTIEPTMTTITAEQADLIADALFDQVPMQNVWRVVSIDHRVHLGARNHTELDLFIAVTMFGNAALRIREAMGECEAWECEKEGR